MSLKQFLWLLPFCCFIIGYQLLNIIFTTDYLPTPQLIGLPLDQAVKLTAQKNLNLRIIAEKPDPDLPNHTVISQVPTSQSVRPNQTMHVVISQKPTAKIAPKLIEESIQKINQLSSDQHLQVKFYQLPNSFPQGICFAQSPAPKEALNQPKMIAYLSSGPNKLVVMPNFSEHAYETVLDFLHEHQIKYQIITACQPTASHHAIIDQRPIAGTILDLSKLTQVQLCINELS